MLLRQPPPFHEGLPYPLTEGVPGHHLAPQEEEDPRDHRDGYAREEGEEEDGGGHGGVGEEAGGAGLDDRVQLFGAGGGARAVFAEGADVVEGLDGGAAHPGEAHEGETGGDEAQGHHVHVVGGALLEFVFFVVDQARADVLVHEEEAGEEGGWEGAEQAHGRGDGGEGNEHAPSLGQFDDVGHVQGGTADPLEEGQQVGEGGGDDDGDRSEIFDGAAPLSVKKVGAVEGGRLEREPVGAEGHLQRDEGHGEIGGVRLYEIAADGGERFVDEVHAEERIENLVGEAGAVADELASSP
mmetsp:Transcript_29032/g.66486  ORF Transcript_29032/g.66486 Transcript_29032/m.66486 type:complete len:297 (-) Transcript_29032:905-1795(-)